MGAPLLVRRAHGAKECRKDSKGACPACSNQPPLVLDQFLVRGGLWASRSRLSSTLEVAEPSFQYVHPSRPSMRLNRQSGHPRQDFGRLRPRRYGANRRALGGIRVLGAVDFHQLGTLAEPMRLIQERVLSGLAALSFYAAGQPVLGWALAILSVGYHALIYMTGARLLKA
jgi:hypothetical protein